VDWFLTGALIACSAGIVFFTGYLVYRLFRLDR
jgi:hypothetical protein